MKLPVHQDVRPQNNLELDEICAHYQLNQVLARLWVRLLRTAHLERVELCWKIDLFFLCWGDHL